MWRPVSSELDSKLVEAAVSRIVTEVLTGALATSVGNGPWVSTAYVAFKGNRFWFTSQESTRHVAEMRQVPAVGLAMWKAPDKWGEKLLGLQLSGRASEVSTATEAEAGLEALHDKFPGTLETLPNADAVIGNSKKTCLFMVECDRGSVRDEANIGKGRFPIVWES